MSANFEVGLAGNYDEEDMLSNLHDASMSDNAVKAATSRMLKEIMPVVVRMAESESKRLASDDRDGRLLLVLAAMETGRNVLTNLLLNIAPPEAVVAIHEILADSFAKSMKEDWQEVGRRYHNGEWAK